MFRRTIPLAILIVSLLALMAPAGSASVPEVENCSFWRSVTTCDVTIVTSIEQLTTSEACGTAGTREGTFERTHYENTVTQHKGAPNSNGKFLSSVTTTYHQDGAVTWGACIEPESDGPQSICVPNAWKTLTRADGSGFANAAVCKAYFG